MPILFVILNLFQDPFQDLLQSQFRTKLATPRRATPDAPPPFLGQLPVKLIAHQAVNFFQVDRVVFGFFVGNLTAADHVD